MCCVWVFFLCFFLCLCVCHVRCYASIVFVYNTSSAMICLLSPEQVTQWEHPSFPERSFWHFGHVLLKSGKSIWMFAIWLANFLDVFALCTQSLQCHQVILCVSLMWFLNPEESSFLTGQCGHLYCPLLIHRLQCMLKSDLLNEPSGPGIHMSFCSWHFGHLPSLVGTMLSFSVFLRGRVTFFTLPAKAPGVLTSTSSSQHPHFLIGVIFSFCRGL